MHPTGGDGIRTPDQRLRVFISSTLGELADERLAARAAVEQIRLAAVMFELGARPHPPRALYRSYLEQSDVFVGIYWQRYGWVAPDMQISGLEDEYLLSTGMPRLIYVKRPAPDIEPRLGELLARVQAEDTTSYKPFGDAAELQRLLVDDLAVMLTERFDATRATAPAMPRARTTLPAQTSKLIGRETVLEQLHELLDVGVRLLTLTGAGGTGKTRLALHLAAERSSRFDDGAAFVDLSAEREPEGVFTAIARALAIGSIGDAPAVDALARELRDSHLLLVLDNCDHVVDAANGIDALLQQCPHLTILATSQVALRVRGEQLFPVPPLSLPHGDGRTTSVSAALESGAVMLFAERARTARPDFAITDDTVDDVVAICRRLDGLPLALELAAARVNVFPIDELRARLDDRLDILQGRAHDLPERQRTLRAAIEWSKELLTAPERRMLAFFSVFSGARLADVEGAASHVAQLGDLEVIEELSSLVDKSLVRSTGGADGRPRLSMLQTIKTFAAEQLDTDADVAAAARRGHAQHYTARASALRDAELDAELANLRAAWSYWKEQGEVSHLDDLLGPLWSYYDGRGDYRATTELGSELLDVLATRPESPERSRDEAALHMSLARAMVATQGFTAEAEQRVRAAVAQAEAAGNDKQRFPALRCLASLHLMRNDFTTSVGVADELLALAEREQDLSMLSEAHLLTGINCLGGSLEDALAHVSHSAELEDASTSGYVRFRVGPHPKVVANTVKGLILWLTGNPDSARTQSTRALALAIELGHPYSTCYAFFHAGLLDLWCADLDGVAHRAEQLLDLADRHEYPIWRALALVLRGAASVARGAPDAGLDDLDAGFALYEDLPAPLVFWPALLMLRATTSAAAGRLDAALAFSDAAGRSTDDRDPLAPGVLLARGELARIIDPDDISGAAALFERSAALGARQGCRMIELQARTHLATLRRDTPAAADAEKSLREVLATFTEGFDSPQVIAARAALDGEALRRDS